MRNKFANVHLLETNEFIAQSQLTVWDTIPYPTNGTDRRLCHFYQNSEQIGTCSGIVMPVDDEHPANAYLVWVK
jgi:hypothetical protein